MKKVLLLAALLIAVAAPSFAYPVDLDFSAGETGWTRWFAPWGDTYNWATSGTVGTLSGGGGNGSFGWWQAIPASAGDVATILTVAWQGDIGAAGWAEVMIFGATTGEDIGLRCDTGNNPDIAFKKDSWGLNPPTAWSWQCATLSPLPAGNGGTVVVAPGQDLLVVGFKLGGFPMGTVSFDCIHLDVTPVPEPGSLLALGTGLIGMAGFVVRRRR